MDHGRITDDLYRALDIAENLRWIDSALEDGRKVELRVYDGQRIGTRNIVIAGEVLQDAILKMVRGNENEKLMLYMDELDSLIKEGKKV